MFKFFWDRVGDDWLLTRTASRIFGFSAMVVTVVTIILLLFPPDEASLLNRIFWAVAGVVFALSIFFLWSGMWRFWTTVDQSSRSFRRVSFLLLLLGIWYGAVVYYLAVYLPVARKRVTALGKVNL